MILDLDTAHDVQDPRLQPEVCVVGGGAVGLVLACALAERGRRVLVLEGGGRTLETASQALQAGESIGHPFRNIAIGRYRVLGGSTTYWGGQLYPFDDFVTGARPWIGHEAWPIPAAEMQGWFAEAYRRLGLAGAIVDDAAVWPAIGQAVPALGDDLEIVTTRWVRMRNFARLFGTQLKGGSGPHVLTHANVTAIGLDAARRRVTSLTVRSLNGHQRELRADAFVLANGSLEIVRLLMQPLAGGQAAPWAASRWLGAPLIDHLDSTAASVQVLDHERFHDLFDNVFVGGFKYYPRLRLAAAAQRRDGLVDIGAQFYYRTRFSEHLDYLKMFLRSVREGSGGVGLAQLPRHVAAIAATAWPLAARYFRDRRSFKPADAEVNLALNCEQLPDPRSRLLLSDQTDALGMPRLRVDWQIDGRELRTMRHFALLLKERLLDMKLAKLSLDPALEAGDPAFLARIGDAVHQMGTARMARDADGGVVDADLRVFGSDNLYVAGAAVFPSTGFANPTFTAIALGLRLAARLEAAA